MNFNVEKYSYDALSRSSRQWQRQQQGKKHQNSVEAIAFYVTIRLECDSLVELKTKEYKNQMYFQFLVQQKKTRHIDLLHHITFFQRSEIFASWISVFFFLYHILNAEIEFIYIYPTEIEFIVTLYTGSFALRYIKQSFCLWYS